MLSILSMSNNEGLYYELDSLRAKALCKPEIFPLV